MLFKKNKKRLYRCPLCNHKYSNKYYGIKAYEDIPLYVLDFYRLEEKNCAWCSLKYFYLVEK